VPIGPLLLRESSSQGIRCCLEELLFDGTSRFLVEIASLGFSLNLLCLCFYGSDFRLYAVLDLGRIACHRAILTVL